MSFLIKAIYDILPTPVNLQTWGLTKSNRCEDCGKTSNLKHILTGCECALRSYTWRHNEVLKIFVRASKICCDTANKTTDIRENTIIYFVKENSSISSRKESRKTRRVFSMLNNASDWRIESDLERHLVFPTEIALTAQRPDLIIWSVSQKRVYLIELTVPFEENFDWAHQRKLEKYEDLKEQCLINGWAATVFPVEIGCRGVIANSAFAFLSNLGLLPSEKRIFIEEIQDKVLSASAWIWQTHAAKSNQQSLVVS